MSASRPASDDDQVEPGPEQSGGTPSDPGTHADSGTHEYPDPLHVGAFIRSQRERAKLSVRRLAELAEVSNPYLSQIERGLRKPSAEVLQQVANALRISVESLYVRAGILPHEARGVSTVSEAIDADPVLTPEQKLALHNVYDSFIANRPGSDAAR
jgi:transcriptional regulator with XRE-family HTH domain